MDVAVWNVLHDGVMVAAEGSLPGDLRLSIDIAYLCGHLPTAAGHVVVTLAECERFEYQPYREPPVSDPAAVAAIGLGLLTAVTADGEVSVECSDGGYGGRLVARYAAAPRRHRRRPAALAVRAGVGRRPVLGAVAAKARRTGGGRRPAPPA